MTATITKRNYIRILLVFIGILASVYGMWRTFSGGIFFTYYTNLSNVFSIIVLGLIGYHLVAGKKIPQWLYVTQFIETAAITLTMTVYMFLLAPAYQGGVIYAYCHNYCGSLCVHLVLPLIAIFDYLIWKSDFVGKKRYAVAAMIPPIAYVIFVVILAEVAGIRWGTMKAPYNFMNFGAPCGWFGWNPSGMSAETLGVGVFYMIILLSLMFYLLGLLFLLVNYLKQRGKG